jgi:transcriptional regulator with XRE-family HTH domain
MDRSAELSHFLRSRRARITPGAAGLSAACASRRVPGLRRDEVARLAGMSPEYYARLEQGRARNPSSEILEALGRALSLDAAEREYLNDLCVRAGRVPATPEPPQRVQPGLLHTLETLNHVPAFILGRRADVLAANSLACAVLTDFNRLPAVKRNFARFVLLDPQARERCIDWEQLAADIVATLRLEAGRHPYDRRFAELIGELSAGSPEFAGWWDDHHVRHRTPSRKRYRHPVVGEMTFFYESLQQVGEPEQTLCVYNVQPGSGSAQALQVLRSWIAPARESAPSAPAGSPVTTGSRAAGPR